MVKLDYDKIDVVTEITNKLQEGKRHLSHGRLYGIWDNINMGYDIITEAFHLGVELTHENRKFLVVNKEDYLKVVKENERYNDLIKFNERKLLKELKEKDKEIERLKDQLEESEYVEETWTLRYYLNINGKDKEVVQYGMIKEDAEELIGMDSDNWYKYSLEKEKLNMEGN